MPRLETIRENRTGLRKGLGEQSIPMLETLQDDGQNGAGNEKQGRMAREVYQERGGQGKIMDPEKVGSKSQSPQETVSVRKDLEWYSDLMVKGEKPELKGVKLRVEETVESESEGSKGEKEKIKEIQGTTPRMKPSRYDGLTPYEDYRVQFSLVAELNGWSNEWME
jgi:hypothetical protein